MRRLPIEQLVLELLCKQVSKGTLVDHFDRTIRLHLRSVHISMCLVVVVKLDPSNYGIYICLRKRVSDFGRIFDTCSINGIRQNVNGRVSHYALPHGIRAEMILHLLDKRL